MWELMLVPMFFIIAIWGYGRRIRAAGLFMLFSQSGGLLMLLSIAALYFSSGLATGHFTFDYNALLRSTQDGGSAWWLMLGFFAAFAIKMGIVPFHAWVREAYAEAPISGAMVLSGIMTKTAVYGLLRFAQPLFPPVAASFSRIAMIIGVVTLLYGAAMAFAQTELRRMIAYVSISAMGLLLLGAYGGNDACREGTVVMMVSHGITLAALFMIAGILMDRLGGTEFSRLGGLWSVAPRLGGAALVFSLAAMSLPGMGTFVGEALVLFGVFQVSPPLAAAGTLSIVFSVMFATQLIGRVFHGESKLPYSWRDLTGGELGGLAVMIVLIIGIGLYPRPLLVVKTPAAESGIEQGQTVRKTPAIKDTSVITGMP
jgi:NADH-quinone oxidoreductase subunit M